ncbi:MAG: hypothetical protein WBI18_05850 [Candidatus Saccharicenans sp.]
MSDLKSRKPEEKGKTQKTGPISRRKFLSYAGILGTAPIIGQLQQIQKKVLPQKQIVLPQAGLLLKAFRPDDLLLLDFEFLNLKLINLPRPHLVRENPSLPAYLIVHLPPQSIAEEVFYEASTPAESETPKPPPVFTRISGGSRLAFLIPDEIKEIPLTLESLLAWHLYQPSLVPVAQIFPEPGPKTTPVTQLSKSRPSTATRSLLTNTGPSTQTLYLKRSRLAQTQVGTSLRASLKPSPPEKHQTAIEFPYRLILSPNPYNVWLHSAGKVSTAGWTELWHTRLAALNPDGTVSESESPYLAVRAVWSPDVDLNNLSGPPKESKPRLSLSPNDRHQIVHLSSNFTLKNPDQSFYDPRPVKVNRMMLSSLGAWFDSAGHWNPMSPLSVTTWQHLATIGRDHFVRVVYKGYLLPFGHRAALVKEVERKFYKSKDGQNIAYLFQKEYLIIRDPDRIFPAPFQPNEGRDLPFKMVRITSKKTPPLDDPEKTPVLPDSGRGAFWPKVGGKDFEFHVVAVDHGGQEIEFRLPMIFIDNEYAFNINKIKQITGTYNSKVSTSLEKRRPALMGQSITFAPEKSKGDTAFETYYLTWKLVEAGPGSSSDAFQLQDQPMCFPALEEAEISIPALKNLVGFETTKVQYVEAYLKNGFSFAANKGELLFQIRSLPRVNFGSGGKADKAGGIATPSFSVGGLSRTLGPVGTPDVDKAVEKIIDELKEELASQLPDPEELEKVIRETIENELREYLQGILNDLQAVAKKLKDELQKKFGLEIKDERLKNILNSAGEELKSAFNEALNDIIKGTFSPEKFFSKEAKILGGILLKDIIDEVNDFTGSADKDKALKIKNEQVYESDGKTPAGIKTLLKWTPSVHDFLIFIASRDGARSKLTLDAEAITYFNGKEATYKVKGELTDFTLDLIKGISTFILVKFSKFTFISEKSKKTKVDPKIASIEFRGPLKFIKELLDKIPLPGGFSGNGGFGGQPIIKVDAAGAKMGYVLAIPDVAFGVFTLQNLKFSGEIQLPFAGDPVSLRFAFNEKNNPFLVTVSMFGGGGFFAIVLQPHGIKLIEGALEFGGSFAMNLGVASGGVTLMAGIYFKYEDDALTLTGYVRCTGELEVLGLISISAEFYLSLTYEEAGNRVWGQASLTVKVKVIFFSTKVTLKVEREFGHSPAPLFCDLMEEKDWLAYCEAFA